jgi:hypothetical protein
MIFSARASWPSSRGSSAFCLLDRRLQLLLQVVEVERLQLARTRLSPTFGVADASNVASAGSDASQRICSHCGDQT